MRVSPAERFWPKVDKRADGCWLWTSECNHEPKPYGRFWSGERKVLAHRFSYELLVGPIPDGLQLDHLCRVHRCVNPAHLEVVTQSENSKRGSCPNRDRTHCPNCGGEYEPRPARPQYRHCRRCTRERDRRYRERLRLHEEGSGE